MLGLKKKLHANRDQSTLRSDVILQLDWPIEQRSPCKSAVHVCGLQKIVGKTEEFKNKNFHFRGSRRDNIFFKMKFEKDNVLVSKGIKTLVPRNETKKKTKSTASVNIIIESCQCNAI